MALSTRGLTLAFVLNLLGFGVLALCLFDLHSWKALQEQIGLNAYGYGSTPRLQKRSDEERIALVGGSLAFARSGSVGKGFDSSLEPLFEAKGRVVRVVNLAEPWAGAASYLSTLRDYDYLNPDVICFYDGYDVVDATPPAGGRRGSFVFRAVGYRPALSVWLSGPDMLIPSTTPIDPALQEGSGRSADVSCQGSSAAYCAAMAEAVAWALGHGRSAVVVTPPYVSGRHRAQQQSLAAALTARFAGDRRFRYADRGEAIDLRDGQFSPDGVHLTYAGAQRLAASLVDVMSQALDARR